MPQDTGTITLFGREHAIRAPDLFVLREEIATILVDHTSERPVRRALGGAILLGCPTLLRESRLDYKAAKFDILNFGGAAYSWLRERGATVDELVAAGVAVIELCTASLSPREAEVRDRAGFTTPPAAG